jgi:hypothetical protein
MRVAVFCALILMVATSSEASESCMSVTEARQHFRLVHIYWHGPDHCWDASPGRRQRRSHTVTSKPDQRKWRDAMSEMVPDARVASEISPDAGVAQVLWLDRWAEIKPSAPPLIARRVDSSHQATPPPPTVEPNTRSITVMLLFALLVIALPLAIIALPQGMIYRRESE